MWSAQSGAPTVFINGRAAFRINDPTRHCGGQGKLVEGSDDVVVGGSAGGGGGSGGGGGGGGSGGGVGGARGTPASGGPAGGNASGGPGTSSASARGPASSDGEAASAPDGATSSDQAVENDEIEIRVVSAAGRPVPALFYELELPDGAKRTGTTDDAGVIRIRALVQRGDCQLRFPDVDDMTRKR